MAGHATSPATPAWGAARDTFETVSPATGEVPATFPVGGEREVAAAVRRAREAAAWWAGLGFDDRKLRLLAWKSHLTRDMGRVGPAGNDANGQHPDEGH